MSALLALINQKKQDMAALRKGSTEKLGEGTTTLRILGSWRGPDQEFWHDFGKHFIKNAGGQLAESYICVKKTFGRPCEICDAISEAKAKHLPDALGKLVDDSGAAGRVLVNAINPNHPKEPHKVHTYELPGTVFAQVLDSAAQYMALGVDLIGPAGRDLIITRTGKGMQTKYSIVISPVSSPIPDVKDVNNLDEFVAQESSEQRSRALVALQHLASGGAATSAPSGLPSGLLTGAGTTMLPTGVNPALLAASPSAVLAGASGAPTIDPAAALAAQQLAAQQAAAQQAAQLASQQAANQQAAQLAAEQAAAQQAQQIAAQQAQQIAAQQAALQAQQVAAQQAAALQAQQQQAALQAQQQAAALQAQQQAAALQAQQTAALQAQATAATAVITPQPAAVPAAILASSGDAELDAILADL